MGRISLPRTTAAIAFALSLSVFCASCYHSSVDYPKHDILKFEYKLDLDGYELSKAYGANIYEYSIPDKYDDKLNGEKSVRQIGSGAFTQWAWIRKVRIPTSVTRIGEAAFEDLSRLNEIIFQDGCEIEEIGEGAFKYCDSLSKLIVPSKVTKLESATFKYCDGATEVEFLAGDEGSKLESIGESCFYGCSALSALEIPKSVVKIDREAFFGCSRLSTVGFEEGSALEIAQDKAFGDCVRLASLSLPATLRFIGKSILSGRKSNSVTIKFAGTRDQWNEVAKDPGWMDGSDETAKIMLLCSGETEPVQLFPSTAEADEDPAS